MIGIIIIINTLVIGVLAYAAKSGIYWLMCLSAFSSGLCIVQAWRLGRVRGFLDATWIKLRNYGESASGNGQ